ncbi:hypothetical protein QYF36_020801 [Acer negundo]|nr:hypothetical protein QYF36_020801 [Acer negundo]
MLFLTRLTYGLDYKGNVCGDRHAHPDLSQLELRYWLNPNQVYQTGLKDSQFKLSNARSICLLDFPIPAEDALNWVCDYPDGDIRLSMDNWIDRNYDYFEFLSAEMRNSSLQLQGPCYPLIFPSVNTFKEVIRNAEEQSLTGSWSQLCFGTKFDCSGNQLKELPSSLAKCSDLSVFKAPNNFITSLPEDLANCSKLTKLDLEGNKLTSFSENLIASWTMLTELNASKNFLNGIPESIGRLSRLIRLDLHQNRISSIPPSISGCSSHVEFSIGNNALSALPGELGTLSKLGTLDLHSNQLKGYPAEACQLCLSVLDLSNNSLSGLPPEIGKVSKIKLEPRFTV